MAHEAIPPSPAGGGAATSLAVGAALTPTSEAITLGGGGPVYPLGGSGTLSYIVPGAVLSAAGKGVIGIFTHSGNNVWTHQGGSPPVGGKKIYLRNQRSTNQGANVLVWLYYDGTNFYEMAGGLNMSSPGTYFGASNGVVLTLSAASLAKLGALSGAPYIAAQSPNVSQRGPHKYDNPAVFSSFPATIVSTTEFAIVQNGVATVTVNIPAANAVGEGHNLVVYVEGTAGQADLTPASGTIMGGASLAVPFETSVRIYARGTPNNWIVIG